MTGPLQFADANAFQRLVHRFAASEAGAWVFARLAHHLDRPAYKLSNGKHTLSSLLGGLPVVMLTTIGTNSGKPRTVPVLGLPGDGTVAVIASNFAQQNHPGWYYNLRANPEGELSVNGQRRRFRAVEATGERRAGIWATGLRIYPGWSQYEKRASHREIAVFVLEPLER